MKNNEQTKGSIPEEDLYRTDRATRISICNIKKLKALDSLRGCLEGLSIRQLNMLEDCITRKAPLREMLFVEDCENWKKLRSLEGNNCFNCGYRNGYLFRGQPSDTCENFKSIRR